ncbi:MAG TPA: AAA family ATPase [Solirubrobacterales bacterium]
MSGGYEEFKTLVRSYHPVIAIDTVEEDRVERLLTRTAADLGVRLLEWSITSGLRGHGEEGPMYGTTDPSRALAELEESSQNAIYWFKDFTPHLGTGSVARQLRELTERMVDAHATTTLVLTGAGLQLPPDAVPDATYYVLPTPSEDEYGETIDWVLSSVAWRDNTQIDTSQLDKPALIQALSGMTLAQARQAIAYAALDNGRLGPEDIPGIVGMKAKAINEGGVLEYFPPEDGHRELGGFDGLKAWLADARMGFSEQAEAFNLAPPKGVLIVGVQGCGKSEAAKVIAHQWGLPLLRLDAGRLYGSLMGESERNFRRATSLAEALSPDVLWIDEIEKGFAPNSGDGDAGLSQRIFGSFLTWLQEKKREVFVIATANDLAKLPPELQRKGRFDEIFFVDLPGERARGEIWQIQLRAHNQDPGHFDLPGLVAASDGFTGAEIEQCVISSLYAALRTSQPPSTELLLAAIGSTVPLSVTRAADIDALRDRARDFRLAE